MTDETTGDAIRHPPHYTRTPRRDLSGQRFGKLVVIEWIPPDGDRHNSRWLCKCDCGNDRHVVQHGNLTHGKVKSCGCAQHKPKKKRLLNQAGYVLVDSPDHPRAGKWHGRVLEHILVMEEHLNRLLLPGEEVHHVNANRADNRIDNLELWTHTHPSGARVEDHVNWAIDILKTYAPEILNTTQ